VRAKRQSPSYGYDKLLDEALLKRGYPYPTGKKAVVDRRAKAQPFSGPTEPDCIPKAERIIYF
jgi:hypothetical protein